MTKYFFVKNDAEVLVIEVEVLDEHINLEKKIKDTIIEMCLSNDIVWANEGVTWLAFIDKASNESFDEYGFAVKGVRKLSDIIIDGKQQIVTTEEIDFCKAFNGRKGYHWGCVNTALKLSRLQGLKSSILDIDAMTLLLWGAEFTKDKSEDLEKFFEEKIKAFQVVTQGGM